MTIIMIVLGLIALVVFLQMAFPFLLFLYLLISWPIRALYHKIFPSAHETDCPCCSATDERE